MEADETPAAGDSPEAFTRLWDAHRKPLKNFITSRLSNTSLVDDVLQEVSVILWDKFGTFKAGTDFLAWAKAVAHFRILRACYDQKRRPATVSPELVELMHPELPPFDAEIDERVTALKHCMQKLSAGDREVIVMRYEKRLEGKKIAEQLRKRANYIYKKIGSIRQQLHLCIKRHTARNSKNVQ